MTTPFSFLQIANPQTAKHHGVREGNFIVRTNKTNVLDLHTRNLSPVMILASRSKAVNHTAGEIVSFNKNSETFRSIKSRAERGFAKYLVGTEALLVLPNGGGLVTYFFTGVAELALARYITKGIPWSRAINLQSVSAGAGQYRINVHETEYTMNVREYQTLINEFNKPPVLRVTEAAADLKTILGKYGVEAVSEALDTLVKA